jgi:hypothetical protein
MAKRRAKPASAASPPRKQDLDAIALIRSSGILNPNARLDEVLKLTERLNAEAQAKGHVFIFRNVVLVECPV